MIPPGALIVVADMSLAMISVLTNLMVITSIRRKEEMMAVTFNMVSYKCHHTIQRKKPPSQSKDDLTFQDLFKTQACKFFKKFID